MGPRVIKNLRVYLNDTGLLSNLLGITVDRIKAEGTLAGAALENFVFMELRKQSSWSTTPPTS
jgi:predicted AAA+ superfamily ATPase